MNEPIPVTGDCFACKGSGYLVRAACCGNLTEGGECRGDCCIPEPYQCDSCGGEGLVTIMVPGNEPDKPND